MDKEFLRLPLDIKGRNHRGFLRGPCGNDLEPAVCQNIDVAPVILYEIGLIHTGHLSVGLRIFGCRCFVSRRGSLSFHHGICRHSAAKSDHPIRVIPPVTAAGIYRTIVPAFKCILKILLHPPLHVR